MENPEFYERLKLLVGDDKPFAWAARVGLSKGAFNRVWNQGTIPSHEGLVKIKTATGVSLDWLLTGEGGNEPVKVILETSDAEDYLLRILPCLSQIAELHYSDNFREKAISHLVRFKNGEAQLVYSKMGLERGARISEVERVRHGMAVHIQAPMSHIKVSEELVLSIMEKPSQQAMEDLFRQAKNLMVWRDELAKYRKWINFDEFVFAGHAQYEAKGEGRPHGPIEEFLLEKRNSGQDTGWVSLAFADCFSEFREWLEQRRKTAK